MPRRQIQIHGLVPDNEDTPDNIAEVTDGAIHVSLPAVVDPISGALTVINSLHKHIHAGIVYHVSQKITGLISGASAEFLIKVPANTYPHLHKHTASMGGGDIDFIAFEGPTVTADGTAISAGNTNRNSANTPSTTFFHTPTITADGTAIHTHWVPPSPTGQGNRQAGILDASSGEEWLLKPSTNYLHRITNNGADTIDLWIEILFYELT